MDLVLTLTGGLSAALALGFVAQRAKLSPIVGYLAAGVVVGPFTPGFVAHGELANQLAEIGIILLMFGVGLSFHVKELLAVRRVAVPGAVVGVGAATALGAAIAWPFGWATGSGVVFGLSIGVASTVVVAVLKVGALVAFTILGGRRAVPALLGYVAKSRSRELFTLTVLVLALGIAVGSARLFGASMALGAFLAGLVVGQSSFSARAASEALPMRDAFAVLFFVSVGMLFDPAQLVRNASLVAATLGVVLVGKPVAVFLVVRALGHPARVAVTTAGALAQIGEFSFVLAALGGNLGLLSEDATQAIVVASMVSITLSPIVFRRARSLGEWLERRAAGAAPRPAHADAPAAAYRAVVVGYGPVGRTVTRLLRENGLAPTVIELNHETVDALRAEGVDAVYGDASHAEVMRRAGAADAVTLVFAASGSSPEAAIRAARDVNPAIRVLARSTYVREVAAARRAGAHDVVVAEAEVALAMTEHVLVELGATSEQLDRERARVRRELSGTDAPEIG